MDEHIPGAPDELSPGEDEVLARLRDADPARGIEPSPSFVASVVARALAEEAAAPVAGETGPAAYAATADHGVGDHVADHVADPAGSFGTPTPQASGAVVDLAAERARRRPRWFVPLTSTAAALVVGLTGYAVGAGGIAALSGSDSAGGAADSVAQEESGVAPPIALDMPLSGDGAAQGTAESGYDAVGGMGGGLGGAEGMSMIYPGYGFRTVFTGSGFGTQTGTATAYGLDARTPTTAEAVAALATAFGIEGEPQLADGAWQVGRMDGTEPSLWVSLDGAASFWFTDNTLDPWAKCGESVVPYPGDDADEAAWRTYDQAVNDCYEQLSDGLPSPDEAQARLVEVLTTMGLDPADYVLSTEGNYEGSVTTNATATRVVDGQATAMTIQISLVAEGLYSVGGSLAEPVALGEYPIVSETEALARFGDPRFGVQNAIWPADGPYLAYDDTSDVYTPPTEAPALPDSLGTVSWPIATVQLTSVRLGLAQIWQPDSSLLLVPAYEFTSTDGVQYSVIAVAESSLDFGRAG